MEDFLQDVISRSVKDANKETFNNVTFAIKRDVDGKIEFSVQGNNPERVVDGFKRFVKLVKEELL